VFFNGVAAAESLVEYRRVALVAIVGMYFICTLAGSVAVASRRGYHILPVLPVVFAMYHVGYGYGFWRGIWHFLILRRKPHGSFVTLTRVSND